MLVFGGVVTHTRPQACGRWFMVTAVVVRRETPRTTRCNAGNGLKSGLFRAGEVDIDDGGVTGSSSGYEAQAQVPSK